MNTTQIQTGLNRLGWKLAVDGDLGPKTTRAVRNFQTGWALGLVPLAIDGIPGRMTSAALTGSLANLARGAGTASANFSFLEFACKCGGRQPGCEVIKVHRTLVAGLQAYRQKAGRPVTVVSGYRCPQHNRTIPGAATNSQHLYGAAADIPQLLTAKTVAGLHVFSGIGYQSGTGLVRHVDVRHASGHNTTGATLAHPTIYPY